MSFKLTASSFKEMPLLTILDLTFKAYHLTFS